MSAFTKFDSPRLPPATSDGRHSTTANGMPKVAAVLSVCVQGTAAIPGVNRLHKAMVKAGLPIKSEGFASIMVR